MPPLGIGSAKKATTDYSSDRLVQDFVFYTADLSLAEAAGIAGVSTATLSRWRMMGARQLRADVRGRLLRYVSRREKQAKSARAA